MATPHLAVPKAQPDRLDLRIVAALQIDGRASWRKIAAVLGEPERTVARRGSRLIDERVVVVTGLAPRDRVAYSEPAIVSMQCSPGTIRVAAASLARRNDTTLTYVMTGPVDCVAEVWCPPDRLPSLLLDELPGTPGLVRILSYPILRYYRTVHEWQPGILERDEVASLAADRPLPPTDIGGEAPRTSREDRTILRALAEDGRQTHEELARLAGVSEATVRRRIEALRAEARLFFRAVVEPATLGLPVESLLWIKAAPDAVDLIGERILESHFVRYAAAITGPYQLLVDVTLPNKAALHEFTTRSPWLAHASGIEVTLLVEALKRSAVLAETQQARGFS
ncbi:Lrp/AsnC family transcriptional regulator [Amycolatopsis palatopharyngis]|uniref:Lrp/AsnC family transcriptional regulator n=1 Tax=Amycolatopsis palatopharyngis TaxID=187982 RepID=UPI000E22A112|nr:AsnC family transcriptional regulator [Amycolatopsis palatopharyngis]